MEDKKYSVYVHRVVTDDNGPMYYVGVTKNVKRRWAPSLYKETALEPYIIQYGWDNLEHSVFADGLDYKMARKLEDTLILLYRHFDCCINRQRSGLIEVSDKSEYLRNYRDNNQEFAELQRQRQRNKYVNDPEYAEQQRQYKRNVRKTPEGKIYNRVSAFNRYHPDLAVETPKEARDRYLATGYIPQYIKHDDL